MSQAEFDIKKWVKEYTETLLKRALYRINQKEIAEDLVQETFITAYQKIHQFKGNSKPQTWLTSILNHKIIDFYRVEARKKTETFTQAEGFDSEGSWIDRNIRDMWKQDEQLLDNEGFNLTLANCMGKLPSQWKIVITAKYLDSKKAKDICKELDITTSNYWQLVHRAKLQLKGCLENNFEFE